MTEWLRSAIGGCIVAVAVATAPLGEVNVPNKLVSIADASPTFDEEGAMPEFESTRTAPKGAASGGRERFMPQSAVWLNSEPLSAASLRGKVVLVDFWTYSCINSLRNLPYVQAWAAKYKEAGLVVIGVHTPEFSFEQEPANVSTALR